MRACLYRIFPMLWVTHLNRAAPPAAALARPRPAPYTCQYTVPLGGLHTYSKGRSVPILTPLTFITLQRFFKLQCCASMKQYAPSVRLQAFETVT